MLIAYFWLNEVQWKSAVTMTGVSGYAVSKLYRHFRRLVESSLTEADNVIGGPGIVVELDETKIGRRKYNRGHRVEGVWLMVGVERTVQRRVFLVPVADRSAETIQTVIKAHIAPGTILHTDGWRGYTGVSVACSVDHKTVNHSEGFINRETGVHTNTVEGTNFAIKRQIPIRARVKDGIEGRLAEFVWRRQNMNLLWDGFMSAMSEIITDED